MREDLVEKAVGNGERSAATLHTFRLGPGLERDNRPSRARGQPQQRFDLTGGIAPPRCSDRPDRIEIVHHRFLGRATIRTRCAAHKARTGCRRGALTPSPLTPRIQLPEMGKGEFEFPLPPWGVVRVRGVS